MSDQTKKQNSIQKPPPVPPTAALKTNPAAKNVNKQKSSTEVVVEQQPKSSEVKVNQQLPKPSEVKVNQQLPKPSEVKVNQQLPKPFGEVKFKPFAEKKVTEQQQKSSSEVKVMEEQSKSSVEEMDIEQQQKSSNEVKVIEQPKSSADVKVTEQQSSGTNKVSTVRNRIPAPKLQSIHSIQDNFNPEVDETIRKCYVVGQIRNSKNLLIQGIDRQLMLLQARPNQQLLIGGFYTILNVHYDITRASTEIKLVKADTIYNGKFFTVNEEETNQNIRTLNIKLEGHGRDARELTKEELLDRQDGAIIEKLTVKATWVGNRVYNKQKTIRGFTEDQVPLVISLDTAHHDMIQQDQVYTFVRIQKVNNWKSTNQMINDVDAKFKTTPRTTIHRVDNPGTVFVEMGKEIGRVILIDQQLVFYDQCPECWKTRINQSCNQSNCSKEGLRMEKNQKFLSKFAVMGQDNKLVNYKVWSDQLLDCDTQVPEDELADVILLNHMEDHFENKLICFKSRTEFNSDQDDRKFLTEVTVKQDQNLL